MNIMQKRANFTNSIKLILFAVILGAVTGAVIWLFLRAVGVGTIFIWESLRVSFDFKWYAVAVCSVGGLIIGIFRKIFGDLPEELTTVMEKVSRDGHYDYSNMFVMLIAAFLPLIFASSVGPEAGLTGVIVGLCYWIGDNLKYAREHEREYSKIGEAVTLGVLFGAPLFGIFAVEEDDIGTEDFVLPKPAKLVLYGSAIAGGLIAVDLLTKFFGAAMGGFPSFAEVSLQAADYVAMIPYVLCGVVMAYVFEISEKLMGRASGMLPPVVCETVCGLLLGIGITFVPMVAFSGEEQMGELSGGFMSYTPAILIGIALLKIIMTTMCIKLGMKGGHFFPLIFACVCMGFGVGMLLFGADIGHLVFAAGCVSFL